MFGAESYEKCSLIIRILRVNFFNDAHLGKTFKTAFFC